MLGALAALGATGGAAAHRIGGRPSGDETTIATVARRDRPLRTAVVPTDWFERERRAGRALAAARSRYADAAGVLDVTLGTDGEPVAGRPTSSVDVHVDPDADDPVRVPATVDGVASRRVEGRRSDSLVGDGRAEPPAGDRRREPAADASRDRPSVGGSATLRSASGATASATCGVSWRGERYLLTCAHLFEVRDGGCDDVDGRVVRSAAGRRIGRVVRSDPAGDWALVDDSGGVRFDGSIAGVEGEVCGRVTAAGLRYLKSEGVEVFKTGQATREYRGPIRAVGVRHGGCDLGDGRFGRRYVDVDVPAVPGDSGGPVYHAFEYDGRRLLAMVGAVAARVDWTRASSADAISLAHGVEFAPTSPFPV